MVWSQEGGQRASVCWNFRTTAVREVNTHQRPSYSVFPLSSRCRFTPPNPSAVESSKWQQRIDLLIHERDGLLQRAPGDKRVEAHTMEKDCEPPVLHLDHFISKLSCFENGFMENLGSFIQWCFPASPTEILQCFSSKKLCASQTGFEITISNMSNM